MAVKPTPLAQALTENSSTRVTPLVAFKFARRWWLEGRRLNLSAMAEELGIGRATLMRWVGNKEMLLGEVLWSLYKGVFERAKAEADARGDLVGTDYLAWIYHEVNAVLVDAPALKQFLDQDPKFGLQVLTSNASGLQARISTVWQELIETEMAAGRINPLMAPEDIAYFIVRIGEGALYSDLICGREPALEPAATALRLLLSDRIVDGAR